MSKKRITATWEATEGITLMMDTQRILHRPLVDIKLANGQLLQCEEGVTTVTKSQLGWVQKTSMKDGTVVLLLLRHTVHGVEYQVIVEALDDLKICSMQVSWQVPHAASLEFVSIPYDNDDWVRYVRGEFGRCRESYDVGFVLDTTGCWAVGSQQQDVWKTAIATSPTDLRTICGYTSPLTRDTLPHGAVAGKRIESDIYAVVGGDSYQTAFESYLDSCTRYHTTLMWEGGVPFGWNSFAAFPENVGAAQFRDASDYFADTRFTKCFFPGSCYINLDFAPLVSDTDLQEVVAYSENNGQNAGFYCAPFVTRDDPARWGTIVNSKTGTTLHDLLLCDHQGNPLPAVDNLLPLDPTHPEMLGRVAQQVEKHIRAGFKYIKIDFLGHGSMEGCYYNKVIRTGRQAYNYAMAFIKSITVDKGLFVSASIAPVFPFGYAHARRICCDCFGTSSDTEYATNALAWGYPLHGKSYAYNDSDHTVLLHSFKHDDTSLQEARARLVASAIAGTVMMFSDDYANSEVRRRADLLLQNDNLLELIALGKAFVPVELPQGDRGATLFRLVHENRCYLAAFNFGEDPTCHDLATDYATVTDLFTGTQQTLQGRIKITLDPKDATIIMMY